MSRFVVLCLCVLALTSCKDRGQAPYARARAKYQALVEKGARPESPEWNEVVQALKQVPADSPRAADAQRLLQGIEGSRVRLRAPLAVATRAGDGGTDADVLAAREACVQLARAGADAGVTPELLLALDACRHRAEVLDAAHVHSEH